MYEGYIICLKETLSQLKKKYLHGEVACVKHNSSPTFIVCSPTSTVGSLLHLIRHEKINDDKKIIKTNKIRL